MTASLPLFSTIRLISLAVVAICAVSMPPAIFTALFTSILFGHYAMSLYYSKNQVKNLTRQRATWLPVGALVVVTLAYVSSGAYVWGLAAFIGLHIALSETYMVNLSRAKTPPANVRWHLNLSRYITNAFIYALLLHKNPVFASIPIELAFFGLVGGFGYFTVTMKRFWPEIDPTAAKDYVFFEVSGIVVAMLLLANGVAMAPPMFVYYHIITWILYPAVSFRSRGDSKAFNRFLVETAVITGIFFLISAPGLFFDSPVDLKGAIPLWATLHFVSSFPLSRLNPALINRYF